MPRFAVLAVFCLACAAAAPAGDAGSNAPCPFADGTVITYNPNGYDQLFRALKRHATPCLQYYVTVAPTGDKTQVRVNREGTSARVGAYIRSASRRTPASGRS